MDFIIVMELVVIAGLLYDLCKYAGQIIERIDKEQQNEE